LRNAPQARISQFLGALIKGMAEPMRFTRNTWATEQRVESSHDAKHVLATKIFNFAIFLKKFQ
jgi:hypothetical protein